VGIVDVLDLADGEKQSLISYVKANVKELYKKMVTARRNALTRGRMVAIIDAFIDGSAHVGGSVDSPKISTNSSDVGINITYYCIMVYHENGEAWHKVLENFERKCSVVKTSRAGSLFILAAFIHRLQGDDLKKETMENKMKELKEWLSENGDQKLAELKAEMDVTSSVEDDSRESDKDTDTD